MVVYTYTGEHELERQTLRGGARGFSSHLLRISMRKAWDMREHLLIGAFISFGELDHPVQDEHFPIVD